MSDRFMHHEIQVAEPAAPTGWFQIRTTTDHEAACLFERHWREELHNKGLVHGETYTGVHMWYRYPEVSVRYGDMDERTAILTAVDAVLMPKEKP